MEDTTAPDARQQHDGIQLTPAPINNRLGTVLTDHRQSNTDIERLTSGFQPLTPPAEQPPA